jgi:DNA adenine methylase
VYLSPLRYPGGKGDLAPFLGRLIRSQRKAASTYVEPFAGGGGAAVRLLFDEYVNTIVLNDLDPGVAAFWRAVFHHTADLIRRISRDPITIEAWHRQRQVYLEPAGHDDVELGFATLFLNRTNRSGILGARPIGGLRQAGRWKIDARFDRVQLVNRIEALSRYRNRVSISQEDGVEMVGEFARQRTKCFVYLDPPYLGKGSDLYLDTLRWPDHRRLAGILQRSNGQWLVTYDRDDRVPHVLYPERRCAAFNISHTAALQHVGSEYAVFSDELSVETLQGLGRDARFLDR